MGWKFSIMLSWSLHPRKLTFSTAAWLPGNYINYCSVNFCQSMIVVKTLQVHFSGPIVTLTFLQFATFQSPSNMEMFYWIAFKFHNNILHQVCYSNPTISIKILFFINLQFTHFWNGFVFEFWLLFFHFFFHHFRYVQYPHSNPQPPGVWVIVMACGGRRAVGGRLTFFCLGFLP